MDESSTISVEILLNHTLATFSLFWTKCLSNNHSRYMTPPLAASQHNATWHDKEDWSYSFSWDCWVGFDFIQMRSNLIWWSDGWRGTFLFCPHCKTLFIFVTRSSSVHIFYPLIFVWAERQCFRCSRKNPDWRTEATSEAWSKHKMLMRSPENQLTPD